MALVKVEYVPAKHDVHDDDPTDDHNPAPQAPHAAIDVAPLTDENNPAAQDVHDDDPIDDHVPGPHKTHDDDDVADELIE